MSEGDPSESGGSAGAPAGPDDGAGADASPPRLGGSLADAYVLADAIGATRDVDDAPVAAPSGAETPAAALVVGSLADSARPVDPAALEVAAVAESGARRSARRGSRRRQRAAGALAAGTAMILGGATMAFFLDADEDPQEVSTLDPSTTTTEDTPFPTSGRDRPSTSVPALVPAGASTSTTAIIGEPTDRSGERRDRNSTRNRGDDDTRGGGGGGGGGRTTTIPRPPTTVPPSTTTPPVTTTTPPVTTTTPPETTTTPPETTTTPPETTTTAPAP
jgi:hypothetical protein